MQSSIAAVASMHRSMVASYNRSVPVSTEGVTDEHSYYDIIKLV